MLNPKSLPPVETPHLAIIHLLRAKGCCSDQTTEKRTRQSPDLKLSQLKQTVERRLEEINKKLRHVPCAVKLEQEVKELEMLTKGLRAENQARKLEAQAYTQKFNRTMSTRNGTFYQSFPKGNTNAQIDQQLQENKRLEGEYHQLLQKIRYIHNDNEHIVNNFDHVFGATYS